MLVDPTHTKKEEYERETERGGDSEREVKTERERGRQSETREGGKDGQIETEI